MKDEKDILNIFSDSFEQSESVGEADWQEISLKNQSRQFWKWNFMKINVYYVGLILVSFLGTFVIGTDYYITKDKITHAYESEIQSLEERISLLEASQKSGSGVENKKLTKRINVLRPKKNQNAQGHSTDPVSSLIKERRNNLNNVVSPEGGNSSQSELLAITPLENKANLISQKTPIKDDELELKPDETLEDSTFSVGSSNITPSVFEKEGGTDSVHADLKVPELEEQAPVIKYVQDTIYEIDSSKVSRWKFKKTK